MTPSRGGRPIATLVTLAGMRVGEVFRVSRNLAVIGRRDDVDLPLHDEGVAPRHAALVRCGDKILLKDLDSASGTYRNGARVWDPTFLEDGDTITIGATTILKFTYQDDLEDWLNRDLYDCATRDALTGLYNRRHLDERVTAELTFAGRHGALLALMIVDVDHFKNVNDQRGYQAGDRTLQEIGRRLLEAARAEDLIARYDGEAFAVLCRETGVGEALKLAERLRLLIADELLVDSGLPLRLTASAGIAVTPHSGTMAEEELLSAADWALHEAKRRGRDRIVIFDGAASTLATKET